jgi:hypothetical protein
MTRDDGRNRPMSGRTDGRTNGRAEGGPEDHCQRAAGAVRRGLVEVPPPSRQHARKTVGSLSPEWLGGLRMAGWTGDGWAELSA